HRASGRVVKTLGDGLMAVFDNAERAVAAAAELQESLEKVAPVADGLVSKAPAIKLKVAVAWGEVVEVDGDCFGDAVNVAARLIDIAGDNETLTTAQLLHELPADQLALFRSIDKLYLRGRQEPVAVLRMENRRFGDTMSTMIMDAQPSDMPEGVRLTWLGTERVFTTSSMPLVLGRSPQAHFCVSDSRASRSHARIESHSGHIYLTDLSYNGTHVKFDHDEQVLTLRRGTCTLHGSGVICLGTPPTDPSGTQIHFEVLNFSETQPQC
ncbi:MAG TPA: adenylate/guanylate cyclase domain-containing protein, partial [Aquabacterium sp.]|nr:adenylate/guanylate cyclase domain-containing protein [Aquabacterium sp.]